VQQRRATVAELCGTEGMKIQEVAGKPWEKPWENGDWKKWGQICFNRLNCHF